MNKMEWKVAGLVVALIGTASLATAEQEKQCKKCGNKGQGERPSREQMMQRFDTDGDGQLSESERTALQEEMGKRKGGHPGGERPSREEVMKRFDADGDGQLSESERASLHKAFEERRRKQNKPVE
jgi:hypothetical protein